MDLGIEALLTSALGLQRPWTVEQVRLDAASNRIDFDIVCQDAVLTCPHCGAAGQKVHDRLPRQWRHLDFFQFEAWLHTRVPRVGCTQCGKTSQVSVPWARAGSGFTLLLEALSLSLCQSMPTLQAAQMLRVLDKRIWRCVEHYVDQARRQQDMSKVDFVGIDETSLRKGHNYVSVVHDLGEGQRLLFATPGKDHSTIEAFAQDLEAHGGDRMKIKHACIDMSAAFAKGITHSLPNAQISYDRFHIVALANEAMDEVRKVEWRTESVKVQEALGEMTPEARRSILWGMRRNPSGWNAKQTTAMHWLQRTNLKSPRAWRLKMALREVYAKARTHNQVELASADLKAWIGWARRSRLESFKRLACTLKAHFDAVVRGMLDNRSNARVEAMNGLMQQAKRAARGYRTATNFINIAYLRLSKLTHLPASPFVPATPRHSDLSASGV